MFLHICVLNRRKYIKALSAKGHFYISGFGYSYFIGMLLTVPSNQATFSLLHVVLANSSRFV